MFGEGREGYDKDSDARDDQGFKKLSDFRSRKQSGAYLSNLKL